MTTLQHSMGFTLTSLTSALEASPYAQLNPDSHRSSEVSASAPAKYGNTQYVGFLAEKLKRKSVLNNEMFKEPNVMYKTKVASMLA